MPDGQRLGQRQQHIIMAGTARRASLVTMGQFMEGTLSAADPSVKGPPRWFANSETSQPAAPSRSREASLMPPLGTVQAGDSRYPFPATAFSAEAACSTSSSSLSPLNRR